MSEDSSTWIRRAAVAGAAVAGVWLMWAPLTGRLSSERVGPKPSVGRQVVVLLHGYGASGDDLVGLAKELSAALPATSFLLPEGPHGAGFTGRSWIPNFSSPTREEYLARLATELTNTTEQVWKVIGDARHRGATCEQIVIGGFSQGGRIAAEAALRAPPGCVLGGLVVMSGGSINDTELPTSSVPLRVLVTHGTNDSVVGLGTGLATAKKLVADGHDVRWLEFAGTHQIAPVVRESLVTFLRGEDVGAPVP